ncbi:MAG: hypothetical protein JRG77_00225 [Deltaproteobacteria bacterium]|nr:hypothetical protein [Deltaproteobacteria bacterium]
MPSLCPLDTHRLGPSAKPANGRIATFCPPCWRGKRLMFISSALVSTFPVDRDVLVPIFYLVLGKPVFSNDRASRSRPAYSVPAPTSFLDAPARCTSNDRAQIFRLAVCEELPK